MVPASLMGNGAGLSHGEMEPLALTLCAAMPSNTYNTASPASFPFQKIIINAQLRTVTVRHRRLGEERHKRSVLSPSSFVCASTAW